MKNDLILSRFNFSRKHSGNLTLVILLLAVLGCGCPNSQRDSRNSEKTNTSLISKSASTPNSTPEIILPPVPSVDTLETPEAKVKIAKGEQIYNRIGSRTGLPVMFGWRASKMSLLIPTDDWKKMSKNDQINITYYAENLVREIRIDPISYARRWSSYWFFRTFGARDKKVVNLRYASFNFVG